AQRLPAFFTCCPVTPGAMADGEYGSPGKCDPCLTSTGECRAGQRGLNTCGRRDSNPYGLRHTVLSRAPVPIRLRPQPNEYTDVRSAGGLVGAFAKKSAPATQGAN